MANDIVKRNMFILISALDPNTTFEEIDGIDKAIYLMMLRLNLDWKLLSIKLIP